ncbi:hypothetical protein [Paraconexibacter sp.]|uniref:hypothetical protein n=1 Tax=Paraconexibacter sp. TaxID=2949640 RepID=UPI0035686335
MLRPPRHRLLVLVALASAAVPASAAAQFPSPPTDGTIVTAAGTTSGFAGDGGPATQAQLAAPADVAVLADGSIAIADAGNDRVRRITSSGTMVTAAGSDAGTRSNNVPATSADLSSPRGVTALPGGGFLVVDTLHHQVRRVGPDGMIATVAGSGAQGFSGDGGPALGAALDTPAAVALLPDGGFLVADTGNHRIRRVLPDGSIATVAGGAVAGFAGDGGPAAQSLLSSPQDVAVASDGAVVIADTGNARLRRITPDGTMTTIAGVGPGFAGDGESARSARLDGPVSIAALRNGGFLVADAGNDRVRRITPLGTVFTVAGTSAGLAGDGGLAKGARLRAPGGLATLPGGGFVVADTGNSRVRRVSDVGAVPAAVSGRTFKVTPGFGTMTVRPASTSAALPLLEQDLVGLGSAVDATKGRLNVTTASDQQGNQQTARVYDGPFTVSQLGTVRQPITLMRVASLPGCPTARRSEAGSGASRHGARTAAAAAKKKKRRKKSRRLWVSESGGRWRTATGSTSAAAVGTRWLTTLQCDGTRVTVTEGRVLVRDKIRNRSVVVPAGRSIKVVTRGAAQGR